MAKPTSNDDIVQRHAEIRQTLIDKHARLAAEKILRIKKLSIEAVATVIADEFTASKL